MLTLGGRSPRARPAAPGRAVLQRRPCPRPAGRRGARMAAVPCRAASADDVDVMSSVSLEFPEEGEYCLPGQVAVQRDDGPHTLITMQVKDYPGLLRVVSWVLNGLELIVKEATLKTDEEGFAHNSFWVTDRAGTKLTKSQADLIAERIGDFLVGCTPSTKAMQTKVYKEGPVTVNNEEHPALTVVTVLAALGLEGALLKVTSALANSGCSIQEGTIETLDQPTSGAGDGVSHGAGERVFKFWVTDRSGKKLDYQRATSLVYTMGLVFGKGEGPLSAPNSGFMVNLQYSK